MGLLIMKKRFIALFLMILFMISFSGCRLGYSNPFHGEPDGIRVCLLNSNEQHLYEYDIHADESKIPLLTKDERYIVEVHLTGGPFGSDSRFISFSYDDEKVEIIELSGGGVYSLRILEDFEETTVVVSHKDYLHSFSCDVLLKMQPNEIIE